MKSQAQFDQHAWWTKESTKKVFKNFVFYIFFIGKRMFQFVSNREISLTQVYDLVEAKLIELLKKTYIKYEAVFLMIPLFIVKTTFYIYI
jgi:hypothetical protein